MGWVTGRYRWLRGVHALLTRTKNDDDLRHTARVFGVLFPAVLRVRVPRELGRAAARGAGGGRAGVEAGTQQQQQPPPPPPPPRPLPRVLQRRVPGVYRLVPDVLYHNQVVYRREPRFDDRSATDVSLCFAEGPFGRWGFRLGALQQPDDGANGSGGGGGGADNNRRRNDGRRSGGTANAGTASGGGGGEGGGGEGGGGSSSRVLPLRSVGSGHIWPLGLRWEVVLPLTDGAALRSGGDGGGDDGGGADDDDAWEDLDAAVCEMFHDPV